MSGHPTAVLLNVDESLNLQPWDQQSPLSLRCHVAGGAGAMQRLSAGSLQGRPNFMKISCAESSRVLDSMRREKDQKIGLGYCLACRHNGWLRDRTSRCLGGCRHREDARNRCQHRPCSFATSSTSGQYFANVNPELRDVDELRASSRVGCNVRGVYG